MALCSSLTPWPIPLFFHRHHTYKKKGKEIELAEIGPRFEMKRECAVGGDEMPLFLVSRFKVLISECSFGQSGK